MNETLHDLREVVSTYIAREVAPVAAQCEHDREFPERWLAGLSAGGYLDIGMDPAEGGLGLAGEQVLVYEASRSSGALGLVLVDQLIGRRIRRATDGVPAGVSVGYVSDLDSAAPNDGAVCRRVIGHMSTCPDTEISLLVVDSPSSPSRLRMVSAARSEFQLSVQDGLRGLTRFEIVLAVEDQPQLGNNTLHTDVLSARWVLLCAALAGLARGALDLAVRYAIERRQFGHPIGYYGEIQALLARVAAQTSTMGDVVAAAAASWDEGRRSLSRSARALLLCAEDAVEACDRAQHAFGGWGHMAEFPIGRFVRDARATAVAGVQRTQLVDLVAIELKLPVADETLAR